MDTHHLNVFGSIDYKQPIGKQQDMRTSTYLGTKYMNDTKLGNELHVKFQERRPYVEDGVLQKQRMSDYKGNFEWKFGEPHNIRNPRLDKVDFVKPFYDCKIKFLKRPMRPPSSVSHSDYLWHSELPRDPPALPLPMQTPVAVTNVTIDRAKPGYSKYLDPSATTTRLDYCHRTPQDIMGGIAAKDNITFWNWKTVDYRSKKVFREKDPNQCDKLPSNDCVKRRCEFTTLLKAVPNSGMITEVQENYVDPIKKAIAYDITQIKNDNTFIAVDPFAKKTEYNILGSGDCTLKYV